MKPSEVKAIRSSLGFTQTQFAQLLGVHSLTVSKWERDELHPSPHQQAMLRTFASATRNEPDIGEIVLGILIGAGIGMALYRLLKPAFEEE